jgi:hypothetical protein
MLGDERGALQLQPMPFYSSCETCAHDSESRIARFGMRTARFRAITKDCNKFARPRDLAPRFEHRLFLSATPHNGHSNSFSALLEILDPQRFCRGVPADKNLLNAIMVRRLKDDIREIGAGVFPIRNIVQLDIDGLPAGPPARTQQAARRAGTPERRRGGRKGKEGRRQAKRAESGR